MGMRVRVWGLWSICVQPSVEKERDIDLKIDTQK